MKIRLPVCLLVAGAAHAQVPGVTSVIPMANARAAARTSPLTIGFDQPLTATSAAALKVFSAQRGGLRTRGTTPAVVTGNTLSFAPTAYEYRPGETVRYTVTTAATSSGGALVRPRVGQFTTAVGGTGRGGFVAGADAAVAVNAFAVVLGDVDGDGDLDLLASGDFDSRVSVRLNNGFGVFSGTQEVSTNGIAYALALGDVDGDGDLDLVTTGRSSDIAAVSLNNGSGTFASASSVNVGTQPQGVTLGDVDGDGDLDLLTANYIGVPGTVSVRLNNGLGVFSGTQNVSSGSAPNGVVLGDVDGDGDLDLVCVNLSAANLVAVRPNNGSGVFGAGSNVLAANYPRAVTLGDLDGDGDLDMVTANANNGVVGTLSVRLNNGSGTFSGSLNVNAGIDPHGVVLADIDADGDLDLLASNENGSTVSVRLNDGNAAFSVGPNVPTLANPTGIALGDVDGDGDLDMVVAQHRANGTPLNTVAVRLNGGTGLAVNPARRVPPAFTLVPNPVAGEVVALADAPPHGRICVSDALGRVVLGTVAAADGTARLVLPAGLAPGLYLVRCGEQVRRLQVE